MEFVGKNTIKTDKIINELDKFVFRFIKILKNYSKYAIVSGYVSIFFGRSRGTEDIDIIVERMDKNNFIKFYKELKKSGFWCLNAEDVNEVYDYLEKLAVRFAIEEKVIPNIEFKFAKTESDRESIKSSINVHTSEGNLVMGNIELQIAFKRQILKSDKDIEDAVHLEEVFKGKIDKQKIEMYRRWLKG